MPAGWDSWPVLSILARSYGGYRLLFPSMGICPVGLRGLYSGYWCAIWLFIQPSGPVFWGIGLPAGLACLHHLPLPGPGLYLSGPGAMC